MIIDELRLSEVPFFSRLFRDYLSKSSNLSNFYSEYPSYEALIKAAQSKNFSKENRELLVKKMLDQHKGLPNSEKVFDNIERLQLENTVTITTGHQLSILGGPLFLFSKILSVINLCRELSLRDKNHNYVPVFWMATEDHDIEEISRLELGGQAYEIEEYEGLSGKMPCEKVKKIFNETKIDLSEFSKFYSNNKTLSEATRSFINHFFKNEGLLIIDADDHDFKRSFSSVLKDELLSLSTYKRVTESSSLLSDQGYKIQATARPINLFYISNNKRHRILKEGNVFKIDSTDLSFNQKEIILEVENYPERFSPNVILRPLYQEQILPNIAYTGGPGELSYWLQLKSLFDHFEIKMPVLVPRQFILPLSKNFVKKYETLGLGLKNYLNREEDSIKAIIKKEVDYESKINNAKESVGEIFMKLAPEIEEVDQSLVAWSEARKNDALKSLSKVEQRWKKALEKKNKQLIKDYWGIRSLIYPENIPVERKVSFLSFYLNNRSFFKNLKESSKDIGSHLILLADK